MKHYAHGFKPVLTKLGLGMALVSLISCGGGSGGGNKSSSSTPASSSPTSSSAASSEVVVSSSSSLVASSSSSSSEIAVSSSSSLATSSSSSSSSSTGWTLVWSDEFDGTSIDPAKWGYEKNCWGGGNNEQQCYTDQESNAFVADGILNIVAVKENFTGPNTPEGDGSTTATLPYTSARLRTKNLQEWTFGRFVIRAKLPSGQGTWPAIWMLPTNSPYGTWASSGEIDIMEAVNLKTVTNGSAPETRVYGTLHYGRNWPGNVNTGTDYVMPNNASPADDFHEYALEWEAGEIRWYVDGVHYETQRDTGWYSQYMLNGVLTDAPVGAPFDSESEYHLLLNLAVGGAWAGQTNNTGIDASVFPQTMQVDYVRVYQCEGAPAETGIGCATIGAAPKIVAGKTRPIIGKIEFDGPPLFKMYDDNLATGLVFDTYNTEGKVTYSEVAEAGRGDVFNVVKTGAVGNVYFKVNGDPTNLTNWASDSELVFDVKVNSKADGANLLVKLDSGWPNVSDVIVDVAEVGVWKEYSITLADLIAHGNSLEPGKKANLASIANAFVVDPSGPMDVSFDNIRIEGEEAEVVEDFAPLPLFAIYDNASNAKLNIQKWDNGTGQITFAEVDATDHGKVLNVVKTGSTGSVFFTLQPLPASLANWMPNGELVFDVRVNSKAANAKLLVKMDSEWPKVSDVEVPVASDGEWTTYRIDVATLIARGNSIQPGSAANINAITNVFVIEPSAEMNVDVDNIRLVVKEEEEPEPSQPLTLFEDALAAGMVVNYYNEATISSSTVIDTDATHGNVFNVVKTGPAGNAYFNVPGRIDLSAYATGQLMFDFKVNSKASGTTLLIKIDSGWPNVSDISVPLPADGVWTSHTISLAELFARPNSIEPGIANPASVLNIFVVEPSGVIDVSFDNIQLVVE